MSAPRAIRKHDGRVVAFDAQRLAASVTRAAGSSAQALSPQAAAELGGQVALLVAERLVREYPPNPSTADVRELVNRTLRDAGCAEIAEAYSRHSRSAAELLWRLRLEDEGGAEGAPWDRRRLMDSLRASGVARDPAGEIAREVERQLARLELDRVSASLVHALAVLALRRSGLDARRYAAHRVGVNFGHQTPRYEAASPEGLLPAGDPGLGAFWLQVVHSTEVAAAARSNLLSLEPYPHSPSDAPASAWESALDPAQAGVGERLCGWAARGGPPLCWRADGPARQEAAAAWLARLAAPAMRAQLGAGGAVGLAFAPQPAPGGSARGCAPAITINVCGLLAREALRDPERAGARLLRLAVLGQQAHREREEYWGRAPMRGRELPIAAAGLWNAAAYLEGEPFERPAAARRLLRSLRLLLETISATVRSLRHETGMNLCFAADGPAEAAQALWRLDRQHFAHDGLKLDAGNSYGLGLELRPLGGAEEAAAQLACLCEVAPLFDQPPVFCVPAPIGDEPEAGAWGELLAALAQHGVRRVQLLPGGTARGLRLLTRQLRAQLEAYPLLDRKAGSA